MSPVDAVPVLMDYVQRASSPNVVWRPRGERGAAVWSPGAGVRRGRGAECSSVLTSPPTPFCGGSCLRTVYRDPVCLYGVSVQSFENYTRNRRGAACLAVCLMIPRCRAPGAAVDLGDLGTACRARLSAGRWPHGPAAQLRPSFPPAGGAGPALLSVHGGDAPPQLPSSRRRWASS